MDTEIKVGIGTHVEVELIDDQGDSEPLSFDVVAEQASDFDQGRLGENTPLAQAIMGQAVGSLLSYTMGDIRSVRILSIQPSQTEATGDAAARRQDMLKKALSAIEKTNAAVFASSFSGKWGDYDPGGLEEWED